MKLILTAAAAIAVAATGGAVLAQPTSSSPTGVTSVMSASGDVDYCVYDTSKREMSVATGPRSAAPADLGAADKDWFKSGEVIQLSGVPYRPTPQVGSQTRQIRSKELKVFRAFRGVPIMVPTGSEPSNLYVLKDSVNCLFTVYTQGAMTIGTSRSTQGR